MIDAEFLSLLACPETKRDLHVVAASAIARANERIRAGGVRDREGKDVKEELSGGLMVEGGTSLYPVLDDIPILLPEDSIPLAALGLDADVAFEDPAPGDAGRS